MRIQKATLEYWALLAEIAGAIAIVVSVIYLGVQIRANTKVLRSEAHYNALSLAQRPFEIAIADQGLAALMETAYASPEKLTEGQWFRCSNYLFMQFNSWEYLYYQNIDGSIPTQLWVGADAYFKELVQTKPGLKHFWFEYQHAFDDPFRSYVTNEFAKTAFRPAPAAGTAAPVRK
ncbi:MAG: hypothetical protein ABR514_02330 [Chthoniobacterales bacterium]